MKFFSYLIEFWRGKDLYRILMNEECRHHTLKGKVLDIGSGLNLASYHRFLQKRSDVQIESLDLELGSSEKGGIDLEKNKFPHEDTSVDTALFFNVLEHLYNYSLVLAEIRRTLKPNGVLIGAVPFLVAYHPDPYDYWRFTQESLRKIFITTGYTKIQIKPFGYGPLSAGFSQMEIVLPRFLKIILVPGLLFFDWIIIKLYPKMGRDKFFLGLFFTAMK